MRLSKVFPLDDPALFYLQGEQMRAAAFVDPVFNGRALYVQGSNDPQNAPPSAQMIVGDGAPTLMQLDGIIDLARLNANANGRQIRANACICCPMGVILDVPLAKILINPFVQSSVRWSISGVTKDSTGSPLGNCRVIAFETGRMGVELVEATVGETISDGSGNYAIATSLNVHHQLAAYKPGSPDVAGITRNDVTPAAVG